ncbi:MAG: TRAP transporter small permease, partial [Rhodospirillaceae bacterium]|nr:TRAP transporter small permease [Rhodospirillaceae bacterium]
ILAACIAVTWGITVRNLFLMSTVWELEASVYAVILACFLGAAYTHNAGGQIATDLLRRFLSPRGRRIQRIGLETAAALFFTLVAYSGWAKFYDAASLGWRSETLWGPPLWIPYLAIPVGSTLLALTLALRVAILAGGGDLEDPDDSGH